MKEFKVKHQGENLFFYFPYAGSADLQSLAKQMNLSAVTFPTFSQTVSLIYEAHNQPDHPIAKSILESLSHAGEGLTSMTLVRGMKDYIQIIEGKDLQYEFKIHSLQELAEKGILEHKNNTIRTSSYGRNDNNLGPLELERNEYINKIAGDEGAKKIAELVAYSNKPAEITQPYQDQVGAAIIRKYDGKFEISFGAADHRVFGYMPWRSNKQKSLVSRLIRGKK
ncbi:MAG: hypothetical protein WCK29_01380 [archaeon]